MRSIPPAAHLLAYFPYPFKSRSASPHPGSPHEEPRRVLCPLAAEATITLTRAATISIKAALIRVAVPGRAVVVESDRIGIDSKGCSNENGWEMAVHIDGRKVRGLHLIGTTDDGSNAVFEDDGESILRGVCAGAFVLLKLLDVHSAKARDIAF